MKINDENEDVIHAQRILDDVTGEEFERAGRPFQVPDDYIKSEGKEDPQNAAAGGRAHAQFPVSELELGKIDNQRDEHADVKCDPKPDTRRHGAHSVSRGRTSRNCKRCTEKSFLSRSAPFDVTWVNIMDTELEKLVESGKVGSKAAEQLDKLKPGAFCLHKSWGFGRIAEWNLLLNQIVIDFPGKKGHPMQLQYAADNLVVIPSDHFLARKANDLPAVKKMAKEEPAALMRNILESYGGKATVSQISEWLIGDIFTEAEWKRWWESTKKCSRRTGILLFRARKRRRLSSRSAPVSHVEEMLNDFHKARQSKEQAAALEQIVKYADEFKAAQLQPIIITIEQTASRNQKLHPGLSFELVLGRDDLLQRVAELKTTNLSLTLSKMISTRNRVWGRFCPNCRRRRKNELSKRSRSPG